MEKEEKKGKKKERTSL